MVKIQVDENETLNLTGSPDLFGEVGYSDNERRWSRLPRKSMVSGEVIREKDQKR